MVTISVYWLLVLPHSLRYDVMCNDINILGPTHHRKTDLKMEHYQFRDQYRTISLTLVNRKP